MERKRVSACNLSSSNPATETIWIYPSSSTRITLAILVLQTQQLKPSLRASRIFSVTCNLSSSNPATETISSLEFTQAIPLAILVLQTQQLKLFPRPNLGRCSDTRNLSSSNPATETVGRYPISLTGMPCNLSSSNPATETWDYVLHWNKARSLQS